MIQLKKGVIELCTLHFINNQDSYGYEIYKKVDDSIGISESTIYPVLRKFVKEGKCATYLKESSEGPARKYFKITQMGKEYFSILLLEYREFTKNIDDLLDGDI